jgi:serine/threonine-protein kinase
MSCVYLADDLKHDRKVALKVLRADSDFVTSDRFTREIRLTAQLTHPLILPLLDSGQIDGHAFYVMPYVEGESLRDRLVREKQLPFADVLQIARDVGDALAYAHAHDVVHRDIKPENILLSAGHAVVADFGIARAISAAASVEGSLTYSGVSVGTPSYMSPEQSLGENVDGRTDVYALGCVVFEMLTGRVPFHGTTAAAMLAHKVTGVIPDVGALRGAVPPNVVDVVQRSLARDVDDRFQNVEDFTEALSASSAGEVVIPRLADVSAITIAVLPFVSMSPNAEDEYLGDGISEELMHVLAGVAGLRVVARTSAFTFKKANADVREIGRRLRARRVVEGSVRRSGNRLRVTAKLVDTDSALEIWSERFDRKVDDLFDIQDEIATSVARRLKELLFAESGTHLPTGITTKPPPTASLSAYEEYLKGRYHWGSRTEAGLHKSAEHLERAVSKDPAFALAHAALADTVATLGLYGMASPDLVMPRALASAERALALDPSLAEALAARGCVAAIYHWNWSAAERDFARAIAADAQYPTAHHWFAAHVLVPLGRFAEAEGALARAHELDPLSLTIGVSLAALRYYQRRYDEAVEASHDVLRLDARFAMAHYFRGLALEQMRRIDDARSALAEASSWSNSAEIMAAVAHVSAAAGDDKRARQLRDELAARSRDRYLSPTLLAQIELSLGDSDAAMEHLEAAHRQHSADLIWLAVRPTFDALHADPRFQMLLAALGLRDARLGTT